MRIREPHRFPPEQLRARKRAARLEWLTLGLMATVVTVMFLATGNSQAMRTAWVEDMLSLIPPIVVLIAIRMENRKPCKRFPFGYYRSISIAFLCAAFTLAVFGAALLLESLKTLITRDHPSIGTMDLFGVSIWQGWLMIAALIYSSIPPVVLGRLKEPIARSLHNKALHADAQMNRADWMTALAAGFGIVGIGYGLWWADALAAALISLDVLRDGLANLATAIKDLMDEAPRKVGERGIDPLIGKLQTHLDAQPWIKKAAVMLREEGHLLTGQIYFIPRSEENLVARIESATQELQALDWRLYDLALVPVSDLD